WWWVRRDWRAGSVLIAVAAGWLPWIWFYLHDHRIEYNSYAVVFDPFLILSVTLCLGLIMGPAFAARGRRVTGALIAGGYLLAVLADFAYLYPVLTGQVIPYGSWLARMWNRGWI
ncbi:MAG: phospholipid carrier-dependent glycosyltransferase, partial [Actinomycetota bacterium]